MVPDEKLKTAQIEPQCGTVQQKKKLNQRRTGINSPEKKQQRKQIPSSQILQFGHLQPKTRSKEKHYNYQKKKELFIGIDKKASGFVLLGQIKQKE